MKSIIINLNGIDGFMSWIKHTWNHQYFIEVRFPKGTTEHPIKKEITELLEAGFEWVGQDNDGLTYFRKRK